MREVKIYEPVNRRYVPSNLFCTYCGNTHQFQIDLKLQFEIDVTPNGSAFGPDPSKTKRILDKVEQNIYQMLMRSYDRSKPLLRCANCGNTSLDMHDQMLEMCWSSDRPGCSLCLNYIEKDYMIELCTSCIYDKEGKINDDDCSYLCPYYDNGLGAVREYYNLSLDELKRMCGFDS